MGELQLAIIFGPAVVGWSDEPDPVKDPKDQQLVSWQLIFYSVAFSYASLVMPSGRPIATIVLFRNVLTDSLYVFRPKTFVH